MTTVDVASERRATPLADLLTTGDLPARFGWVTQAAPTLTVAAPFHPACSLHNPLLVWAQQPDATEVADAETWRRLGRRVRAGQHGLVMLVPADQPCEVAGLPPGAEPALVFDRSQTRPASGRGGPAATLATLLERHPVARACGQTVTRLSSTPGLVTRTLAAQLDGLDLAAAHAAAAAREPRPATALTVLTCTPSGLRARVHTLPPAAQITRAPLRAVDPGA